VFNSMCMHPRNEHARSCRFGWSGFVLAARACVCLCACALVSGPGLREEANSDRP